MFRHVPRWVLLPVFLVPWAAAAQGRDSNLFTNSPDPRRYDKDEMSRINMDPFLMDSGMPHSTDLQTPDGAVSKFDLKAPGKARREYERGLDLLKKKDLPGAAEYFAKAVADYPKFVAAHNALGTAYLKLGRKPEAKKEFALAIALDDHLPNSYLNLGCAEIALNEFGEAEESMRKASSMAPVDVQLQLALTFAEYLNKDYSAVLATSRKVHGQPHEGAARVHLFAAGAWEAQGKLEEAQLELKTLLQEDPRSESGDQYRRMLAEIEAVQARRDAAKLHPPQPVRVASNVPARPSLEEVARAQEFARQQDLEASQIAEAEAAPNPACMDCDAAVSLISAADSNAGLMQRRGDSGATFRVSADEVSVLFAATFHGKSVTDLAASDVEIRDDGQPPRTVLGFRSESQLPLRLGLLVDTSESVLGRFSFEMQAAGQFLRKVVENPDDLAFVVGFNSSVLLVQDFTGDQKLISHAVNELAPRGETAIWDAVAFAADKLANHPETQPVARILVVISDGEDNASKITLKQAIASAQRGEVAVFTVNSRDSKIELPGAVGDHALRTLSELTGATAYKPGPLDTLDKSLAELQQVIRGRYLISYRPASFQRDDRYRSIDIHAQKDGRKLTVFARKGYYASAATPSVADR